MRNDARQSLIIAVAMVIASPSRVFGADCCCDHCGCTKSCEKVCRLVCEEKKVDVICWGCKCEDFCVPGPSKPACRHCEEVCGTSGQPCDCTSPQGKSKRFLWTEWIPGCAKIYTKKKLLQKVVTKKAPGYKWVVEDLCPHCEASCGHVAIAPGAELPPPPTADARLLYATSQSASHP
jgi:hypothetical protein